MSRDATEPPRLLEEAFVVRFRPVASARSTRFDSYDGMVSFIRGLLGGQEAE